MFLLLSLLNLSLAKLNTCLLHDLNFEFDVLRAWMFWFWNCWRMGFLESMQALVMQVDVRGRKVLKRRRVSLEIGLENSNFRRKSVSCRLTDL